MIFIKITKQNIMQNVKSLIRTFSLVVFIGITGISPSYAVYELPNDDGDCPENCRQIPWQAGSDQWNRGVLPVYTSITCTGLVGDIVTDDGPAIQSCINRLNNFEAAFIPAGTYFVNSAIVIPSFKALRGEGMTRPWMPNRSSGTTTLNLGANSSIRIGPSWSSTSSLDAEVDITSGYTKGSQSVVVNSGHGYQVGDWIGIAENADPAIVSHGDGGCDWCGDNSGANLINQFVQITSVDGDTLGLSRPLYYTYQSSLDPTTRRITWGAREAGIEDIKLNGQADSGNAFVYMEGVLFGWVKNVETYYTSATNKAAHVRLEWSHGVEVRGSYLHRGRSSRGDENYGIGMFFWNSDHKIENNIMRNHRHSIVFEGGGSGTAILYNYIDDNWETDTEDYLGSARTNHGPHPMFELWEGNQISHLEADDVFGGSSHQVLFRNWLRGEETGGVNRFGTPSWGFYGLDIRGPNWYFSAVGNILGDSSWTAGTLRTTSANDCTSDLAAYYTCCQDPDDYPSEYDSTCNATLLVHGNYDYISDSVVYWEGGSDHVLKSSMYYRSKPDFFGNCAWPVFGPDLNPITGTLPAKNTYEGQSACIGNSTLPLIPPTNLEIVR